MWVDALNRTEDIPDFLNRMIQLDHGVHEACFIRSYIEYLMKLTHDVEFPKCQPIMQWLDTKDKEDHLAFLLETGKVCSITGLFQALNQTVYFCNDEGEEPSAYVNAKGLVNLFFWTNNLRKRLENSYRYREAFFLEVIEYHVSQHFEREKETVENQEVVRTLMSLYADCWTEYHLHEKGGNLQTDAYLIYLLLAIVCLSDDPVAKEEEFTEMIYKMAKNLHPKVSEALNRTTTSSPFEWDELMMLLNHLKKGDDSVLKQESDDISGFESFLQDTSVNIASSGVESKHCYDRQKEVLKTLGLE